MLVQTCRAVGTQAPAMPTCRACQGVVMTLYTAEGVERAAAQSKEDDAEQRPLPVPRRCRAQQPVPERGDNGLRSRDQGTDSSRRSAGRRAELMSSTMPPILIALIGRGHDVHLGTSHGSRVNSAPSRRLSQHPSIANHDTRHGGWWPGDHDPRDLDDTDLCSPSPWTSAA